MVEPIPRAQTRSLLRGLAALEHVAAAGEAGVGDVAAALEIPRASAHILLSTLTHAGYLRQPRHRGPYRLDLKVLELTHAVLSRMPVRERAAPLLHELATATGLAAYLAVLFRGRAMTIDRIVPTPRPEARTDLGHTNPAYASSMGKAILAHLSASELERYLDEVALERLTEHTLTTLPALREELARVRERGYALSEGEHRSGVRSIAAPVFAYGGEVVAAICVRHYVPAGHPPDGEHVQAVRETAQRISHALGHGAEPR
ncbi:MAG TPA: IclR family transcriptional regulator [Chloroflexota bacterium]|nr:IclR family transcriptional regulator [Chloroflexota bacterium]